MYMLERREATAEPGLYMYYGTSSYGCTSTADSRVQYVTVLVPAPTMLCVADGLHTARRAAME